MNKNYKTPVDLGDLDKLKKEALQRRIAMRQAGLTTYIIGVRGGAAGIVCLCCGLGSSHYGDINKLFCGFCDRFHEEVPSE